MPFRRHPCCQATRVRSCVMLRGRAARGGCWGSRSESLGMSGGAPRRPRRVPKRCDLSHGGNSGFLFPEGQWFRRLKTHYSFRHGKINRALVLADRTQMRPLFSPPVGRRMSASPYLLWEEASLRDPIHTAARACAGVSVSVSLCTRLAVSRRPALRLRGSQAALAGPAPGTERPVKTRPR